MLIRLAPFVAGFAFALGLGIAGMTQPNKVIGFLDFGGDWDASLAFVMVGAIAVYATAWRLIARGSQPQVLSERIDPRLLGGAALFGIGWGLSGFCPGPAIVSLSTLFGGTLLFVVAMVGGQLIFDRVERARHGGRATGTAQSCG